jgi:hypothetical protein
LCIVEKDEFSVQEDSLNVDNTDSVTNLNVNISLEEISSGDELESSSLPADDISSTDRVVEILSCGKINISIENDQKSNVENFSDEDVEGSIVYSSISSEDEDVEGSIVYSSISSEQDDFSEDDESFNAKRGHPIFACDGVVGDLNHTRIISLTVENGSVTDVLDKIKVYAQSDAGKLNRNIWLSVGNFVPLLQDLMAMEVCNKRKWTQIVYGSVNSMMSELDDFNTLVKSAGGKLRVLSLLPSPCVLDPLRANISKDYQQLAWRCFLKINKEFKGFNFNNGNMRTLCVNSFLHMKTSLRKKKQGDKCGKIIVSEKSHIDGNKRVREGLHAPDGIHLHEPTRLIIVNVVTKVICKEEIL